MATGPQGVRRIAITDFFTGFFVTALAPNEILTEIRVPIPPRESGGAYCKLKRKVGDFATAAVAVQLSLRQGGDVCAAAGIALTNVGPTAIKASRAEEFLRGQRINDEVVKRTALLAAEESQPRADLRGSEEYKRDMVRVLTVRALNRALARARGGA